MGPAETQRAKHNSDRIHEEDGTAVMKGVSNNDKAGRWTNFLTEQRLKYAGLMVAQDDVTGLPLDPAEVARARRVEIQLFRKKGRLREDEEERRAQGS